MQHETHRWQQMCETNVMPALKYGLSTAATQCLVVEQQKIQKNI
jgi:hypothetical protein